MDWRIKNAMQQEQETQKNISSNHILIFGCTKTIQEKLL